MLISLLPRARCLGSRGLQVAHSRWIVASRRKHVIDGGAWGSTAAPSNADVAETWVKAHADAVAEDEDT